MPQQANAKSDQAGLRLANTVGSGQTRQGSDNSAELGHDERVGLQGKLTDKTMTNLILMPDLFKPIAVAALVAAAMHPLAVQADQSRCTKAIQSLGYFITDIDSDWGRPYDKFEGVKNGKEYDIWVNKSTCKVEKIILDPDRHWYD